MPLTAKFVPGENARKLGVSYRPVTDGDLPLLCLLYRSTREAELAQTDWSEEQKSQFIDMQFRAQHEHYQTHYPDAEWLVIERSDQLIGRLYIEEWPSELRIIDIALLPDFRGKGLGSAILRDIMELAAKRTKAVGIHVEKNNPAMNLYKKLGFSKTEDKGVYDLLHWRDVEPESQANTAS